MSKRILYLILASFLLSVPAVFAQNLEWAIHSGGTTQDIGNAIAVDAAGNVYSTGTFTGTADFDPGAGTFNMTSLGSTDVFIQKLSSSGNFVWAKQIGSTSLETATSIFLDAGANLHITGTFTASCDFDPDAGTTSLSPLGTDAFLLKLDSSGAFIWVKGIQGFGDELCFSGLQDAAGNIYLSGYFTFTADFDPGPS